MKYSFTLAALAAVASAQEFTSFYNVTATPDQVISTAQVPTPGQAGAKGQFLYSINSKTDTICFDITLTGVSGTYQSAARTATHIHEGVKGRSGPPRIAFPNPVPVGDDSVRRSVGCLTGPFVTGIFGADGVTDTGAGFKVSQIEANPAGFFTDSHTALFVQGVVRGQLDQSFRIVGPTTGAPRNGTAPIPSPAPVAPAPIAPVRNNGTVPPSATRSSPPQFTGAASTPQIGGLVLAAAGLVAALL